MSSKSKTKLLVCVKGKNCPERGSSDVLEMLKEEIADCRLKKQFRVKKSGCFGMCGQGPLVVVESAGICYGYVTELDCREIVESHLLHDQPVERLLLEKGTRKKTK